MSLTHLLSANPPALTSAKRVPSEPKNQPATQPHIRARTHAHTHTHTQLTVEGGRRTSKEPSYSHLSLDNIMAGFEAVDICVCLCSPDHLTSDLLLSIYAISSLRPSQEILSATHRCPLRSSEWLQSRVLSGGDVYFKPFVRLCLRISCL